VSPGRGGTFPPEVFAVTPDVTGKSSWVLVGSGRAEPLGVERGSEEVG